MITFRTVGSVSALLLTLAVFPGCASTTSSNTAQVHEFTPAQAQANLEKAITVLQLQFKNPDAPIRANCLEALQYYHDPRTIDLLKQGLQDPDWVVRFAAAMAAGKQQNKSLKPLLQQMYATETDANVKVALIFALHNFQDDTHMAQLANYLQSPENSVRANTALVLGMLKQKSAVKVLLLPARKDPDPRVRFEITAAMARLGDPQAKEDLIALSANRSLDAYFFALSVYPEIDHPDVNNVLDRGVLLPSEFPNLTPAEKLNLQRAALLAAAGLGKRRDPRAVDAGKMILTYSKDPNPELRVLAALALGEILYPAEEAPLMRLLADPEPQVQVAAAAAIVKVTIRNTPKSATLAR